MHKITSFLIAETSRVKKGKESLVSAPVKSAPHYFAKSVPTQSILGREKVKIDGKEVELIIKSYPPDAILVQGSVDINNVFTDNVLDLKEQLLDACFEVAKKRGAKEEPSEEYTLYQVSEYNGDPELFLRGNMQKIAGLLKSEKLELGDKEVEHTLSYQFKYAKDDLIILDWDGAFVFDPKGDFNEIIELCEIANYQLLRYRIIDEDLDSRLKKASKLSQAETGKWFRSKKLAESFRELIKIRSQSISQFESMERDIKLIGDWYSARLFDLFSKKFRLEDWRQQIRSKMEALENIYSIVSENLGMSRMQVLEFIQIGAFFVLQIGWFILIILEFFYFT